MRSITTYTAADDSRIAQFQLFSLFFRAFNPTGDLKVIPFGDKTTLIEQECKTWGFELTKPSSIIDECGKSIFGNKEYRPGLMAWRYMRKLNCFIDSNQPFIFLDANNLVLCDTSIFKNILLTSHKDVLFSGISAPKRTINLKMKEFYEVLDESIGSGYNCSIILSKNNVIQERDFELLSNPNMAKFFKKAPEQGYIALLLSLSTIKHGIIPKNNDDQNHGFIIGRSKQKTLDNIIIDFKNLEIRNPKGKLILTFKSTGAELTDIPLQVKQLVDNAIKR